MASKKFDKAVGIGPVRVRSSRLPSGAKPSMRAPGEGRVTKEANTEQLSERNVYPYADAMNSVFDADAGEHPYKKDPSYP